MAEITSPFLSPTYEADRDIASLALKQHAFYLGKVLGDPEKEILSNLKTYFQAHADIYKSKTATALIKDKNEDRQVKIVALNQLLKYVEKKNYHLSPSMVGYKNSDEEECVNAIGTRLFIKNRSFYKKLRQKAKSDGDSELYDKYDKLQNAFKIFNNAQSGAMSSEGTPINNSSGHTSLTSTTRCLTSTANLVNEQFIAGNRFYNTPANTLQSITSRLMVTDYQALQKVMEKYNLYYPSADDVMERVVDCSRRYWNSPEHRETIREYLDSLIPLERASVLYTLDLMSLYHHNESVISEFFDEWTFVPKEGEGSDTENEDKYVLSISKLPPKSSKESIRRLNFHHDKVEEKYTDFIEIFFKSPIPPSGLFDVIHSVRDCVLTSDTDSSIYTADKMVDKYTDERIKGIQLNAVLTYFIRMISVDQHGQLSANMNVSVRNQRLLDMKNEYFFGGYVTTLMSKHYYALKRMCEGVVYSEPEMETKGVHLKGAKISKLIRDISIGLQEKTINCIESKEKLDPAEELFQIGELERSVYKDLNDGKWEWLGKQTIKGAKSYTAPMSSVYFYHEMWEKVFKPKYGNAPDLPYVAVKINVDLDSKTKIQEFVDNMPDKEFGERLMAFCEETGRYKFDTLSLPMENLRFMNNIPSEVKAVLDFRTVIKQNFKSVYTVLESIGLYFLNDKITRLVSDEH